MANYEEQNALKLISSIGHDSFKRIQMLLLIFLFLLFFAYFLIKMNENNSNETKAEKMAIHLTAQMLKHYYLHSFQEQATSYNQLCSAQLPASSSSRPYS